MLEYFLSFIREHNLIEKGERTLVAVSGGIDSMVMADLFLQSPYAFAIVHVNFGLRDEESNRDEAFVKNWCKTHKIKCFVQHAPHHIFEGKGSIQMAARDFRYQYFDNLIHQEKFHKLATAHHLDDSLETVLFNFVNGTGLPGLKGISPIHGYVIRPMLFTEKEEISAYAKTQNIQWREDATNESVTYQRNKIRHQVIPVLKSLNPGLLSTFTSVRQRISDAQDLIEKSAKDVLATYKQMEDGVVTIGLQWITDHENPGSILYEILRKYGLRYDQIRQLQATILTQASGKLFYSDLYEINVDRAQIIIREKDIFMQDDQQLKIPGETFVDSRYLEADIIAGNELVEKHDPSIAYLDLSKVDKPIVTRWEEGDVFYPLGMKGKKKVSDFMIDSKIPLTLKKDVLILKSQEEIAWIVGYRIDERFKVTAETKKMLRLQLHRDV